MNYLIRFASVNRILFALVLSTTPFVDLIAQELSAAGRNRGSAIVDDSTKQIYGPNTIEAFSEDKLRFNLSTSSTIDTSEVNFHMQFYDLEREEYEAQDLGNMGTAWRSMYYKPSSTIGVESGYSVFSKYYESPKDVVLYNTKSPYSWFSAFWGAEGRSITKVGYTRNVNKDWNFGFNFKSYLIDKQVGKERRGDRNVKSTNINLYNWYKSPKGRYSILGIFTYMKHGVTEMGGVDISEDDPLSAYFEDTAQPLLGSVENSENQKEFYTYQRYQITELISLYHELDWGSQQNGFLVESSSDTSQFDHIRIEFNDEINDVSQFNYFTNTFGITGYSKGFRYQAYIKGRNIKYDYSYLQAKGTFLNPTRFEKYAGINLETIIDSTFHINGTAEYMLDGNYRLEGTITSNFLEGRVSQRMQAPSFIHQGYEGHFDYWFDLLSPIESTLIEGRLKLSKNAFKFEPEAGLLNISNNIYFKKTSSLPGEQTVFPIQNSNPATMLWLGAYLGYVSDKSYVKFKGKINRVSGDGGESIPIPEVLANADFGITRVLFNNNLRLQTGLKVHWQSSYLGMAYDPAIQQFYAQDDFLLPDYWTFSAYLNARIDKGTLFMKMNNLRKIFNDVGFFSTPHYPGINAMLDFGFNWKFYD